MIELPNVNWSSVSTLTHECPICGTSCYSPGCKSTLVGYYSPPGHNHDDNCRTFYFACPNGHSFSVRPLNTCPAVGCDWKGREACWCHKTEVKVSA